MKYSLSVLSDINPPKPNGAVTLVEVFSVEVDKPIEWVKQNADQIATKATARAYSALWVEQA